jgi:1-acyl-sn-glycerol-3-phosphate acyltransferase
VDAIRQLAASVRERGVSAVIFPEGTRARHGELGPFKRRGTLALLEAAPEIPVVPVCTDQSWHLLRHNLMPVPFGTTVRVWIGDPIARQPDEDREALLERVEAAIRAALERHRAAAAA